jgi:hypothetical protein
LVAPQRGPLEGVTPPSGCLPKRDLAKLRWILVPSLVKALDHLVDPHWNGKGVFGHRPKVVIDVNSNSVVAS